MRFALCAPCVSYKNVSSLDACDASVHTIVFLAYFRHYFSNNIVVIQIDRKCDSRNHCAITIPAWGINFVQIKHCRSVAFPVSYRA